MTDTILIADDDIAHRDLLDGILAGAGYHIQQAAHGPAGVVRKNFTLICW